MAKEYVILTDSSCDLSTKLRKENEIEYVRMGIVKNVGQPNSEEIYASLDWDLYTNKELNDWQREGMLLKTTQVSYAEYESAFEKHIKDGKYIIYLATAAALSGSYNFSLSVREDVLKKYPNANIICIDTCRAGICLGLVCLEAAKLKKDGKTIEEVANFVNENKLKFQQFGTVETLEYLKRAGRVKTVAAFFGNLFGVKPLITSSDLGENSAVKKVKGRKASINEVANMLKKSVGDNLNQTIYLVHADCIEEANFLKDILLNDVKVREVVINPMGPIISVSTGPGTLIVCCKGEKVVD